MIWNRVIVIGAGGTGSMLLPNLARFLRSHSFAGSLIIADGDEYSVSNSDRQSFNLSKVGTNKAEYQSMVIASHIPDFADNIEYIPEYLSKEDIDSMVLDGTIVINCADNNAIRKYVEDRVLQLNTAAHVCCGNELRNGQVQCSVRKNGTQVSPSIYKQSPNFNITNDDRSSMTCEEIANLPSGGQIIATNMMAASLALNYVVQLFSNSILHNYGDIVPAGTVYYDIFTLKFEPQDIHDYHDIVKF